MLSQDEQWLLSEKYGGEKSAAFFTDQARLEAGEPLAYVIGHIPFLDCTIYLDSKPLIPRSETEYWTEQAIAAIRQTTTTNVLDLCAGSGAIGVAVAKAIPDAQVTFAELDARHLPTIGKNLETNNISCTRYKVWQSDLFANISDTYDFILTNPPYIDPTLDRTEDSVKRFEPPHALYGGAEGMEFIAHIIAAAPLFLKRPGQLCIEHEPEQSTAIADLARTHHFSCTTHKDQYNTQRYSVLVLQ